MKARHEEPGHDIGCRGTEGPNHPPKGAGGEQRAERVPYDPPIRRKTLRKQDDLLLTVGNPDAGAVPQRSTEDSFQNERLIAKREPKVPAFVVLLDTRAINELQCVEETTMESNTTPRIVIFGTKGIPRGRAPRKSPMRSPLLFVALRDALERNA